MVVIINNAKSIQKIRLHVNVHLFIKLELVNFKSTIGDADNRTWRKIQNGKLTGYKWIGPVSTTSV
jgi:hypothetical protein